MVIIAAIVFASLLMQQINNNTEIEKKVLAVAEKDQYVKGLILGQGFETTITKLSAEDIETISKTNPVYSDLQKKTLYEIDYSSAQKGSFVAIVDLEQENVVKFYRVATMSIGGA